jgi:predicted nucleotide-binding protein (sugar kinase/HSP70/actin superfamily)
MANETKKPTGKTATVKIPLERGKKNKEYYVALNGRPYMIKRGMEVEVPKGVAEVIANSEKQILKSLEYQDSMASE